MIYYAMIVLWHISYMEKLLHKSSNKQVVSSESKIYIDSPSFRFRQGIIAFTGMEIFAKFSQAQTYHSSRQQLKKSLIILAVVNETLNLCFECFSLMHCITKIDLLTRVCQDLRLDWHVPSASLFFIFFISYLSIMCRGPKLIVPPSVQTDRP